MFLITPNHVNVLWLQEDRVLCLVTKHTHGQGPEPRMRCVIFPVLPRDLDSFAHDNPLFFPSNFHSLLMSSR